MNREALQMHSVQATTDTMPGDHRRIDITLGPLICHGIVERTTDKYENKEISRILKLN